MKNGLILLTISLLAAGTAWLIAGTLLLAWTVGIVTFLFSLLGGLCYASEVHVDDTYGSDGGYGYDAAKSQFGGRCVSGSWK